MNDSVNAWSFVSLIHVSDQYRGSGQSFATNEAMAHCRLIRQMALEVRKVIEQVLGSFGEIPNLESIPTCSEQQPSSSRSITNGLLYRKVEEAAHHTETRVALFGALVYGTRGERLPTFELHRWISTRNRPKSDGRFSGPQLPR
jgi:hypothetical protein